MQKLAIALVPQIKSVSASSKTKHFNGYPSELLKSNHSYAVAYRSMLRGSELQSATPLQIGKGTEIPTELLQIPGTTVVLSKICKVHECSDNIAWLAYDLGNAKMFGLMLYRGRLSAIGDPADLKVPALLIDVYARHVVTDQHGISDDVSFPLPSTLVGDLYRFLDKLH